MNLIVVSDAHLFKTPDGRFWCNTAMHGYSFWNRYCSVFEKVTVVARTKDITIEEKEKGKYIEADGDGVSVYPLPFIRGMKNYLFHWNEIRKECRKAAYIGDAAIFRLPSFPAYFMLSEYKKTKKPYAVEVVIDPEDEYANIPLLKQFSVNLLKKVCADADGVSYVTKYYLQKKYPSYVRIKGEDNKHFESYYSSIELNDSFFEQDRFYGIKDNNIKILHIANSINNENKGHRTVIKTICELKKRGIVASVTFVGNGDKINEFIELAKQLGVEKQIVFTGYISNRDKIMNYLCESDLFFFPSKAEGLPRVLIEAMATGLPCIASNVDGIPELLKEEYMAGPDDVGSFAKMIEYLTKNPEKLEEMGRENREKAKEYRQEILKGRRNVFYYNLRQLIIS